MNTTYLINERNRAEQAAQESEQRYKRFLASVTDYVYSVGVDQGRPIATTHGPGCEAVTGYTSKEFDADPFLWYRMIFSEDRQAATAQAERILKGETPPPLEHRILHKDGRLRWVRNTPVPHQDERGGVVGGCRSWPSRSTSRKCSPACNGIWGWRRRTRRNHVEPMLKLLRLLGCGSLAVLLAGCASHREPSSAPSHAALPRLGDHHFKVTTRSPEAQQAFDRGLTLAYSFLHYPAEQEFRRAAAIDPDCAMAWWGVALVNGPHINFPAVPPARAATAWDALLKAQARAAGASPLERSLIDALSRRYANPQPADRRPLDVAYAEAMRGLWRAHPRNADVGTLFVEAAMDLHPWDLWKDGGPQPWTPEIVETLERVLRLDPSHPGANHLYVHAIEASPDPHKAVAAADRLRTLVPDASHMVHMPAHIYARVGRWEDAAQSNRDAMKADLKYRAAYPRPGFYGLYMTHNAHFLAFVSMMQGRSADTIELARQMVASIPPDFRQDYAAIADGFLIFTSEALMRFGRWEEILAEPEPAAELPLSRALWRFTRTSAFTALNRLPEARAERDAFEQAAAAVPASYTFGNNAASNLLAIARRVLEGELAARTGDLDVAVVSLRKAAQIEDGLAYDEPPDWIQPTRHTLGAVLLRAGKGDEAELAYREDLARFPDNGWSLLGLRDALRQQDKHAEARRVDARLKQVWARADVAPTATCYCQAYD